MELGYKFIRDLESGATLSRETESGLETIQSKMGCLISTGLILHIFANKRQLHPDTARGVAVRSPVMQARPCTSCDTGGSS